MTTQLLNAELNLSGAAENALKRIDITALLSDIPPVPSPIDGAPIGTGETPARAAVTDITQRSGELFPNWSQVPAPVRGGVVRRLGDLLREHKDDLAILVSIEVGKTMSESRGEVQEMIDICDLALGLSRQIGGATLPSERPGHALRESWHPLGPVAVISAFNFPVAVWAWNTAIALTCGNTVVWKPSELTPACSLACQRLVSRALVDAGFDQDIHQTVFGGRESGAALAADERIRLVSATGSTEMGRSVGVTVAERFARSLLELGGNNASIVTPSADPETTVHSVAFAAAGTSGQRCTTLRRLYVHDSVYDDFLDRLIPTYESLTVGNPLADGVDVGPLITHAAGEVFAATLDEITAHGGTVLTGGQAVSDVPGNGCYVRPAVAAVGPDCPTVQRENFVPVLHVLRYTDLADAIAQQNSTPYGLSSSIYTTDVREAELFLSAAGSDCGIANVNTSTSGAEIGAAFGGEKWTGGGRESGSDAWKAYMRRSSQSINYSGQVHLAQGVEFQQN